MRRLLVLFLVATTAGACGGPTKPVDPDSDAATGFSAEVHVNAAHLAKEDGVTSECGIVTYEVSFDRWDISCEEGASAAGEIDTAASDLHAHGIDESGLTVMRNVANSAFTGDHENGVADLSAYLVLREHKLKPAPATPTDNLTGFGATKATWVSVNGAVDQGPFSAVQFGASAGEPVYTYDQDFDSAPQRVAEGIVKIQLPPDAKIVKQVRGSACLKVIYESNTLKRKAPSLGQYVSAYFYTGFANGPYDPDLVNNTIVSTGSPRELPGR